MTGAFSLAGWHFSRNPTSSSSENKVMKAKDSEPWNTGSDAKYQYHPGGDKSRAKKDAPSALNEVIIPNVNLPKVSDGREENERGTNRFGRIQTSVDGLHAVYGRSEGRHANICSHSRCTRSTTSGVRRVTRSRLPSDPLVYVLRANGHGTANTMMSEHQIRRGKSRFCEGWSIVYTDAHGVSVTTAR